jgi:hypothetical protein
MSCKIWDKIARNSIYLIPYLLHMSCCLNPLIVLVWIYFIGITDIYKQNTSNSTIGFRNKQMIVLLPPTFIFFGFSIFWLWAYLMLLQDVFQSVDFERTWCYSRMFFNLLNLSVPDVTPGCFSIFWLWAYLMLLQDVFQSFDFERAWRYSRMFFNLLTLSVPDVTPGCFSIFWLWACLTLLQDVFQSFDFERTWCYSRMFFNLLTLSVPNVTPGCFSIFWLWAYLMLLQDVFQSFDFERT